MSKRASVNIQITKKTDQTQKISHTNTNHNQLLSLSSSRKAFNYPKDSGSLPKIRNNRQIIASRLRRITQYQTNTQQNPKYSDIYSWVITQQIDYNSWMDSQVQHQHQKLVNALYEINAELEGFLTSNQKTLEKRLNAAAIRFKTQEKMQKMSNKIFKSKHNSRVDIFQSIPTGLEKRKKIQQKQMGNNDSILKMFQKEYKSLKKRQDTLKGNSNEEQGDEASPFRFKTKLQQTIQETKGQIIKAKSVNKKIQMKNKTLGDSINLNDEFIDGMHKLELQVQMMIKKKQKINIRLSQTEAANKDIKLKLANISNQFQVAEQYFQKHSKIQKQTSDSRNHQQSLKTKQHVKQLICKKKQHLVNEKQKIYHQYLKDLQILVLKINNADQLYDEMEGKRLIQKEDLAQLQAKLRRLRKKPSKPKRNQLDTNIGKSRILNNLEEESQAKMGHNIEHSMPLRLLPKSDENQEEIDKAIKNKRNSYQEVGVVTDTNLQEEELIYNHKEEISSIRKSKKQPFSVQSDISSIHQGQQSSVKNVTKKQRDINQIFLQSP